MKNCECPVHGPEQSVHPLYGLGVKKLQTLHSISFFFRMVLNLEIFDVMQVVSVELSRKLMNEIKRIRSVLAI